MIELNKIYNEDCLETMARMESGSVDLTVTSPPYDNLRTYKGFSFEFDKVATELFRITKEGGVVVWVVNDATINGSETGTSFMQALYFMSVGFNLHDTMIWQKPGASNPSVNRYHQVFEYMFVFSKGHPKTFNGLKDRKNKWVKRFGKGTVRNAGGEMEHSKKDKIVYSENGLRNNIWYMNTASQENVCQPNEHPAPFSEELAGDHIVSWSNTGEIIYDPFIGSGTTAKMALVQNRNFVGSEISKAYCEIADKRIEPYRAQGALALTTLTP